MDFAVIKTNGKQYLVTPGAKIKVMGLLGKVNEEVSFSNVLLFSKDSKLEIGTPTLSGVKVTGKIIAAGLGEKVRVAKFKAKSRYRRVLGFRPNETIVEITSLK